MLIIMRSLNILIKNLSLINDRYVFVGVNCVINLIKTKGKIAENFFTEGYFASNHILSCLSLAAFLSLTVKLMYVCVCMCVRVEAVSSIFLLFPVSSPD